MPPDLIAYDPSHHSVYIVSFVICTCHLVLEDAREEVAEWDEA